MNVDTAPKDESDESGAVTLLQVDRAKAIREARPVPSGVVSWSPPQANWNAWTQCNIGKKFRYTYESRYFAILNKSD